MRADRSPRARRCSSAVAGVLLAASGSSTGDPPCPDRTAPVAPTELSAHIRFLSSDLLEGRGPGTAGGRVAESYIETVFRLNGLSPAFGESYRQELTLRRVSPDPAMQLEFRAGDARLGAGVFGTDFVATFPRPGDQGALEGEVVFCGYGIQAERWAWDDFKGADLRGKVLLVLSGEPGGDDPALFEGKALTLHGRWTTKLEEAARRGAAGVLLVHTREGAGYGWEVVRNGSSRPAVHDPVGPGLLPFQGWLTEQSAARLVRFSGRELAGLREAASGRGFRPVPLGVQLRAKARVRYETVRTANVAGLVRGRRPAGQAPVVVLSAHHDHLGIGNPEGGDAIYNGAVDNGSALAVLLALARVLGVRAGELDCDVLLLAPAAEEAGLLGSAAFVRDPPVPLSRVAACLNLEMSAVWGEARDVVAIGARDSALEDVVAAVARRQGLRVAPEPAPEQGFFFRSDQLSFARGGIPSALVDLGEDLAGRPPGTGHALREEYRALRYHRPGDELDPSWELTGTAQLARVVIGLVEEICRRGGDLPWKPGAPYRRQSTS